jgi:Planctomycete cytochrome C
MSGLDMRSRDTLLKGGHRGAALVPGNAEQSLLYQAAAHQGELKMPPGSNSPLPPEELMVLKKWIEEGAAWPEGSAAAKKIETSWWSFKKVRRPPVPSLANQDRPINPIDAFVLVKLKEKGLKDSVPHRKPTNGPYCAGHTMISSVCRRLRNNWIGS